MERQRNTGQVDPFVTANNTQIVNFSKTLNKSRSYYSLIRVILARDIPRGDSYVASSVSSRRIR